jgi:acetyl-CoA carboxylase carboxyl transferase subunit alpha
MATFLDFEKPIAELEARVAELRETASAAGLPIDAEVQRLEERAERLLRDTYGRLTPWQKTQVARHPERPHFKDYVAGLVSDFVPLAGDRSFGEDEAIVGGLGRIDGRRVMLIGHEKGDDTASRIRHNFGMARPEGYRKAVRLMQSAARRKRLRARPRRAWRSACRWSRRSSGKGARAAPSLWRPPIAC